MCLTLGLPDSRMTVSTTTTPPVDLDADLLLVPLTRDPAAPLMDTLAGTFGQAIERAAQDFDGEEGAVRVTYPENTPVERVALMGLGPAGELDRESVRVAAAAGSDAADEYEVDSVVSLLPENDALGADAISQSLVEGFVLGAYRYRRYKTDSGFAGPTDFHVHTGERDDELVTEGVVRGKHLANATCTARDLVNRSPDEKTAEDLAEVITESGASHGYEVDTWDENRIREERMGGLLAVNRGSPEPPTFSILSWDPSDAINEAPIVLVGKGVVFDTGGLSLKDTKGSMDKMKSDMAGAATVIGVFEALANLDVPLHVIGLLPATDNRPGRNAYVPGDVIRMHSGTTVEVLNTDAEGRLLLADALSYASSTYDPELVVDVATLTGSCVVALGTHAAGLMARETDAAAERLYAIQRAGERTGERVHPLPMYEEYESQLESSVADLRNVGGRAAGAITAGKFLEHFIEAPWLHLDIAGPAFLDEARSYRSEGGTGYGVRLVTTYLTDYAAARSQA